VDTGASTHEATRGLGYESYCQIRRVQTLVILLKVYIDLILDMDPYPSTDMAILEK